MNYPLISEYVDAIRSAEDNFDKLSDLRPVLDDNGNPIMSSGNFAVVFKMKDVNTGKLCAVKCFTKEQEGREEAYRQIADELEFVQSTYLAKVKYCDRELFVDTNSSDDREFPVLLMDWVEGETLDRYIRRNINDTYALEMLAYNFSRLAMWLLPQPFAHGDLKPDNILVHDDGSLTLVDYDGMYVPAMQGQKARELGSPDFRHPLRTENDFNEHIDDFPAISILLSLRLIAADPSLLDKCGAADRLLFAGNDYCDFSSCQCLKVVFPSKEAEINTLVGLFAIVYEHKTLANVSFQLLSIVKPQKKEVMKEELSTKVTEEDLRNSIEDEFGTKYSRDEKRLLEGANIEKYKIKDGTMVICDGAFKLCSSLREIIIPNTIKQIGINPFTPNPFIPNPVIVICNSPYFKIVDKVLYNADMTVIISFFSDVTKFAIPVGVTSIGSSAFVSSSLQEVFIPEGVRSIGNDAFSGCCSLRNISIPESIRSIGNGAFSSCSSLKNISIPEGVRSIGNDVFSGCSSLKNISIPKSVRSIGNGTFRNCCSLKNISIPESVRSIGNGAFKGCKSLERISIPKDVTDIGGYIFNGCESLQEISIPKGVVSIGESAFSGCKFLQKVTIPTSVSNIGEWAFVGCKSLREISIPESVVSIGGSAFCNCESLLNIVIPDGVTSINYGTFRGCFSLREITIPKSVTNIDDCAFEDCRSLREIFIPDRVTSIGRGAFNCCHSLCKIKVSKDSQADLTQLSPYYKDKLFEVENI